MTGASSGAPFSFAIIIYFAKKFLKTSRIIIAVGWLLLVTVLLCIPGTQLPKIKWDSKVLLDKWIHVFLFFLLVWFWCRIYIRNEKKIFITICILAILYGIIMEIVQHYFIPFRSFDVGDMIADAIGSVIAYFVFIKQNKNNPAGNI